MLRSRYAQPAPVQPIGLLSAPHPRYLAVPHPVNTIHSATPSLPDRARGDEGEVRRNSAAAFQLHVVTSCQGKLMRTNSFRHKIPALRPLTPTLGFPLIVKGCSGQAPVIQANRYIISGS